MNAPDDATAQAESLIRRHFLSFNNKDLVAASSQLFWPKEVAERPLEVYVATMAKLAPFEVVSVAVRHFDDVRPRRQGAVAIISMNVVVNCSVGQRSTYMSVWWFSEEDRYLIASRPSDLVLERIKADERIRADRSAGR